MHKGIVPSDLNPKKSQLICIGLIKGPHGVWGDVKIKSYTERPENFINYGPITNETGVEVFNIKLKKIHKKYLIARIAGITERRRAEEFTGLKLFAHQTSFPIPEDDEFYYSQLIGLRVFLPNGELLGKVSGVQNFGAGDLLEIEGTLQKDFFVPFTQDIVTDVNIKAGVITIDPPDGLF